MLAGLALYLWAWRRSWSGNIGPATLLMPCLAGVCFGLSVLCKFNGFLGLVIIAAWSGLAMITARLDIGRKLVIAGQSIVAFIIALAVVVGLNPFMTARARGLVPGEQADLARMNLWERFDFQVKHRLDVSDNQKQQFAINALYTLADKAKVEIGRAHV